MHYLLAVIAPLVFTLVGVGYSVRRMDRTENPFIAHTAYMEGCFFLTMFILQMLAYTWMYIYYPL